MRLQGIGASPGYALGRAVVWRERTEAIKMMTLPEEQAEDEVRRLESNVNAAIEELEALKEQVTRTIGAHQARIFETHALLLQDDELIGSAAGRIRTEHLYAETALQAASDDVARMFEGMESEYWRERAADIRDVTKRVLRLLQGVQGHTLPDSDEPVILFAHDLTPSDTAGLNRELTAGLAADLGGTTSHTAIMARSLGIPAAVGLCSGTAQVKTGDYVILDGHLGLVYVNPSQDLVEQYGKKRGKYEERQSEWKKFIGMPSLTADLHQVELVANIGNPQDAYAARQSGAEGIGLYRTEFLYMGKTAFPTEEEQFLSYKTAADLFGKQQPVIIRTLDIGGDKELPYFDLPKESNPFLGYRAIRLCLDRTDLFRTQLRAILRASAYGRVKIMYPMISTLQELRQANRILDEVRRQLDQEQLPYDRDLEVGLMIEVPAAAMVADQLAKEADFFSIGTNDLVQYMMAADRMNERVAHLTEPFNPGVLRMIRNVVDAAHSEGKWVGMCGEMAGNPLAAPLLLGLGIDEFSMSAGSIVSIRALLRRLNRGEMKELALEALQLTSAEEIKSLIETRLPFIAQWKEPL